MSVSSPYVGIVTRATDATNFVYGRDFLNTWAAVRDVLRRSGGLSRKRRKRRYVTCLFSIRAFDVALQNCWRDWPAFHQSTAGTASAAPRRRKS
jgi:hypothetical protein